MLGGGDPENQVAPSTVSAVDRVVEDEAAEGHEVVAEAAVQQHPYTKTRNLKTTIDRTTSLTTHITPQLTWINPPLLLFPLLSPTSQTSLHPLLNRNHRLDAHPEQSHPLLIPKPNKQK